MYQLELKAKLIAVLFPPSEGWEVCVDVDAMERCEGGTHPVGKRERVSVAESHLRDLGVRIGSHPVFGRADVVATHPTYGTTVVEVEGTSSRQNEQAMYSALGQAVVAMQRAIQPTNFALAVPDEPKWQRQLNKIPASVRVLLQLRLFLVSEAGVREAVNDPPNDVLEAVDVHDKLSRALTAFTNREADLIRRDPSERSLTHRLAIHVEREFWGWHVDCEFNRLGVRPKVIEVRAPRQVSTDAEDAVSVFPDIIVHRRGPDGPNLLIIEAKKATSRTDATFDQLKLKAYQEQLGYHHAAFVTLPAGDQHGGHIEWVGRVPNGYGR